MYSNRTARIKRKDGIKAYENEKASVFQRFNCHSRQFACSTGATEPTGGLAASW